MPELKPRRLRAGRPPVRRRGQPRGLPTVQALTVPMPPAQVPADVVPLLGAPPAGTGVRLTGLDPALGALGTMIGVLVAEQSDPPAWDLVPSWFADPVGNLKAAIGSNGTGIGRLIDQLLGSMAGQALGVPVKDAALLGTWYPIILPGQKQPSGLYLVSAADARDSDKQTFGLGVMFAWPLPAVSPALTVRVWGMVPVLCVSTSGVTAAFAENGHPISLGVAVEGVDNAPLFDLNGVSFGGVKVSAELDVHAVTAGVSVVVMQLQLADETVPKDRSLADLAAISGKEIQDTAAALFVGALAKLSPDAGQRSAYLMPLLGLSSKVPGSATELPQLDWIGLFAAAVHGDDLAAPFRNWFRALASDTALLSTWLSCLSGVMAEPVQVSGSGTRAAPLSTALIDLSAGATPIGRLSVTMATETAPDGTRHLYPGLRFNTAPVTLAGSSILEGVAALELAEFIIVSTAIQFGLPSSLTFHLRLAIRDSDATKPLVAEEGYSFGSIEAGLSLTGALNPVPSLAMSGVVTPNGSYDDLDLLNPAALAAAAEDVLAPMLQAQLQKLLGIGGDHPNAFATAAATLIGVVPPATPDGTWPKEAPQPPFSIGQLINSLGDPLGALAGYYRGLLTDATSIQGKAAFTYMVQALGGVLRAAPLGSATIVVTGDGTAQSPWTAQIALSDATLPAALIAWTATPPDGSVTLTIGLSLDPTLKLAGTTIAPSLTFDLVAVEFPTSGPVTAHWAASVQAALGLPDGFTSSSLGGAQVKIGPSALTGRWSKADGLGVSLLVTDPVLVVDGQTIPLGQNLDFSRPDQLQALVAQEAEAFLRMATGLLGVGLLRTRTRPGLAVAGVLGLLKDLSEAPEFPSGLTWPSIEPLVLTGFQNPWPAIRARLAANFRDDATGAAVLSLLAWALDGKLTAAPTIPGTRDAADPYRLPLGTLPFDLRLWFEQAGLVFGAGLGRTLDTTIGKVKASVTFQLGLLEFSLANGTTQTDGDAPAFSCVATLTGTDGALWTGPQGTLGALRLGVSVALRASGLVVAPVVTWVDVTLPGQTEQAAITLNNFQAASFGEPARQACLNLLNVAIGHATAELASGQTFKDTYALLVDLGLALAPTDVGYGINPGGWQALLADPRLFAETQFTQLLTDPKTRTAFFTLLTNALGLTLPPVPVPVLDVLQALDILGAAELGYPVRLEGLLALVQDPFGALSKAFEALVNNETALQDLVSALTGTTGKVPFDPFTLSVTGGHVVSLSVDAKNAFRIGDAVTLVGSLDLDLAGFVIGANVKAFVPPLGLGLSFSLTDRPTAPDPTPEIGLAVVWGDGSRPAPDPLALVPFGDGSAFLAQLSRQLPAYILGSVIDLVVSAKLLEVYPLAQKVFVGLGLAEQVNGAWRMPALPGLLSNPGAWLRSEGILGKNGAFDVAGFAAWLSGLPAVTAPNGLALAPQPGGIEITGLPYGVAVSLTGKDGLATIGIAVPRIEVAGGTGVLDSLSLGVTLGPDYQPGVTGQIKASVAAGGTSLFSVTAGYDKAFAFSIATADLSLQLLPFKGWGSLAEELARKVPAALVQELVPRLLDMLANKGGRAADLATRLRAAGKDLDAAGLLNALVNVNPFTLEAVEKAALDWLMLRLSDANKAATANSVASLLQWAFPSQTITATGGLVSYTPGPSLPITVLIGVDSRSLVGAWVEVELPEAALLRARVDRTGVGVPVAGGNPVFSFGIAVGISLERSIGPMLSLTYDGDPGLALALDPMGNTASGAASSLSRELLPKFFPGDGTLDDRVLAWLLEIVKQVLPRYVAAIVLNEAKVKAWLDAPIATSGPTPAALLSATSLIVGSAADGYALNDIQTILALTPEGFLANFLQALLKSSIKLVSFGPNDSGAIWMGPNPDDAGAFGARLVAPDFPVPGLPRLVLQIGGADSKWITQSGGTITPESLGMGVYVPISTGSGGTSAAFDKLEIVLNNVGLDLIGPAGQPLVDLTRFKLGSVSPRASLAMKLNGGSAPNVSFGVGGSLNKIGLSLTPSSVGSGANTNPVAQNLLGASAEGDTGKTPPANPTFSVAAGYTTRPWVDLYSDTGDGNPIVIPIQRSFGPLHVDSIGVGWLQSTYILQLLFSGGLQLAGLNASVKNLTIGVPVTTITELDKYTLDLQGLDLSFNNGGVSISGGFLKTDNPLSYTGAVIVQAAKFGISAAGSYTVLPAPGGTTAPSLFIFGALNAPLGGVPAFFITGVAAGFGVNRSLAVPDVGDVINFPLVSGVLKGSFSSGTDQAALKDAMTQLADVVQPQIGAYWLGAGLRALSFELIDILALLFVQFGRTLEFDLLGVASAQLPKGLPKSESLAYIELGLKVTIIPDLGYISAEAQLTPNSYVIVPDCKLTGGFAFQMWLKDLTTPQGKIAAGDFVITLGGYHPSFVPPKHYADVPRLGFNWKVSDTVSVAGGAYFALVPTAIMAGGYLNVRFHAGPLSAWLDASANFIIGWAPFFYEVDISVSVGVAFELTIAGVDITLKVELGAQLLLAGPPTHGSVTVDWYVISFTIPFGSEPAEGSTNNLNWEAFADKFLPKPKPPAAQARRLALAADPPAETVQPLKLSVTQGRLGGDSGDHTAEPAGDGWVLSPVPFAIQIDTAIPPSKATLQGGQGQVLQGTGVGVRPVGITADLDSPMTIAVTAPDGSQVDLAGRGITIVAVSNGAPGALWSKSALNTKGPPNPTTMILPGTLMGATLTATNYVTKDTVPAFAIESLRYEDGKPIQSPFAFPPQYGPAARYPSDQQNTATALLMTSIMTAKVTAQRNSALGALAAVNSAVTLDPSLALMAAAADNIVQAPPVLARPGVYQTKTATAAVSVSRAALSAALAPPGIAPPMLERVAMMRRYASRRPPMNSLIGGLPPQARRTMLSVQPAGAADDAELTPGTLASWKIDAATPVALHVSGNAAWRATCFDRHGELTADVETAAEGMMALPLGTSEVTLHGLDPHRGVAGWQVDGELIRLNRYYFAGEGCLLRIQNAPALAQRGLEEHGPCCAETLLRSNLVRGRHGLQPGWTETVVLDGRQRFTVSCRLEDGAEVSGLRVMASVGSRPGTVGDATLVPAAVEQDGTVGRLTYDAPGGDGAYLTIHAVPLDRRIALLGVHAYDQPAAAGPRPPPIEALRIVRSSTLPGYVGPTARVEFRAAPGTLASRSLMDVAGLRPSAIAAVEAS
jgi:hypothetical protein